MHTIWWKSQWWEKRELLEPLLGGWQEGVRHEGSLEKGGEPGWWSVGAGRRERGSVDLPGLEASSVLFSSSSGISGCQLPQMQWEGAWEGQVPIVGAALLEAGGRHCGSCFRIGGRLAKGKIWKAGTDECVGECVSVCVCLSGGFWAGLIIQIGQSWIIRMKSWCRCTLHFLFKKHNCIETIFFGYLSLLLNFTSKSPHFSSLRCECFEYSFDFSETKSPRPVCISNLH